MVVVAIEGQPGRGTIQIEIDPAVEDDHAALYDGLETRGAAEKVLKLSRPLFSEAIEMVASCAEEVVVQLDAMSDAVRPDEFEVQLAVKMDGKVGARIVELASGAQLQVTLRWKRQSASSPVPPLTAQP
jgi:hypothetical protein